MGSCGPSAPETISNACSLPTSELWGLGSGEGAHLPFNKLPWGALPPPGHLRAPVAYAGVSGDPPLFSCGVFQAEGVRANLVAAWRSGWRPKASKTWVQIPVLSPPHTHTRWQDLVH